MTLTKLIYSILALTFSVSAFQLELSNKLLGSLLLVDSIYIHTMIGADTQLDFSQVKTRNAQGTSQNAVEFIIPAT